MKYEDLKGKTKDELQKLILDGKKELFNLRFQRTTGELDKTHRFKQIRREIAMINTFVNSGATLAQNVTKKTAKTARAEKAKAAKAEKAEKVKAAKAPKAKKEKVTKTTKKKAAA
jgi:large subunit ribosomal protein L29